MGELEKDFEPFRGDVARLRALQGEGMARLRVLQGKDIARLRVLQGGPRLLCGAPERPESPG